MDFGLSGTSELSAIERCPYYRDVRKERFHCIQYCSLICGEHVSSTPFC